MSNERQVVTVSLKFDVDKEIETLKEKLSRVMSESSTDMADKMGDSFKTLEQKVENVTSSIEALYKAQNGGSDYGKNIEKLQSQFEELSVTVKELEKTVKGLSGSQSSNGNFKGLEKNFDSLNSSIDEAVSSISELRKASSSSTGSQLADELRDTKKEAEAASQALEKAAEKAKVYKNQTDLTSKRKGKTTKTRNWVEFSDFFSTVTKNATVNKDGSLTITSEKLRTNYEALEKEITKVDDKIIELQFDMGRQGDTARESTKKQLEILREYLKLLVNTRNQEISDPKYLADSGHANVIDIVREQEQIAKYNEQVIKVAKSIDSVREKITSIETSGLSQDYITDLKDADQRLEGLSKKLENLFQKIKSGNATDSDILAFFDELKVTMTSVDDVLDFNKIQKQLDDTSKKIAKLKVELYTSPSEKQGLIQSQIDELEKLKSNLLQTQAALNSPNAIKSQTGQNISNKAEIEQYNQSLKKVQQTIVDTKDKIRELSETSGLSQDYITDLKDADQRLEGLVQTLNALWTSIKAGTATESDVKDFFSIFNDVISFSDETIDFEKIDKQITKLKKDLIEINTKITISGSNINVSALIEQRNEIKKNIESLVNLRNAQLQAVSASGNNTYGNKTASIAKYNEEVIKTTDSLNGMREKLAALNADDSRSLRFKQEIGSIAEEIKNASKKMNDAFLKLSIDPFNSQYIASFEAALTRVVLVTEKYNKAIANSTNSTAYAATREDVQKLDNQISSFLDQNTAAANRFKQQLLAIQAVLRNSLADGMDLSKFDLSAYSEQVNKIESEVKSLHQTGNSFFTSLKKQLQSANAQFIGTYLSIQDIIRYAKEVFDAVVAIDSALTELRKVSDATTQRLAQNLETSAQNARDLGASVKDVINMTADWSRLGYSVDEAEDLARITTLFKNVGDNMSAETASEYMISALQGFQMSADQAERIVDAYNEVANNFAIDTAGIGEALERSAASFNAANTSMEKAIALVTATNEVVQNPESVGTLWKTEHCLNVQQCA